MRYLCGKIMCYVNSTYARYQFYRFLARDRMLSALYAIARLSICLSVCLSVSHTGGSVKNG